VARREASRSTTVLSWAVVTVIVIGLLVWARTILIPLAFAVFLTFVLNPAVNTLRRLRLGRLPAVLAVVSAAVIVAGTVGWLVSLQMSALVQELPDHAGKIRAKVSTLRTYLEPNPDGAISKLIRELEDTLWPGNPANKDVTQPVPVVIEAKQPSWLGPIEGSLSYGAEAAGQSALSFLLVIFLLLGREDMRNRVIRLIGPHRITATTRAVDDAGVRISRYLRIQLLLNATFGIILAAILWVLGVRYAMLWGFIAGMMRYVPYVGTFFGLIPPLLASVAMSMGWRQPLMVLAAYVALEILYNTAVEPHLYGKSLGLSEVAQVFSAAFWAFLWGPVGLVLSGPLTACLLVLGKNVPQLHCLVVLLGDEDPLPPSVTFFQRLTARDRVEAESIAREFAKANTAERAIDELLLPALGQAQAAVENGEFAEEDGTYVIRAVGEIADEVGDAIPAIPREVDGPPVRILIVAAGGKGDALATELLSARLDPHRWESRQLTQTSLASDMLSAIHNDTPAVVVIVALAPVGFASIRYLSKRLQVAGPDVKRIVGRWGGGPISLSEQDGLKQLGIGEVTANLAETLQLLHSWRSMLKSGPVVATSDPENTSSRTIGTLTAM
jgi:predicted PurR-regulated permease PerM